MIKFTGRFGHQYEQERTNEFKITRKDGKSFFIFIEDMYEAIGLLEKEKILEKINKMGATEFVKTDQREAMIDNLIRLRNNK